jgi:hypothetical protein
VPAGRRPFDALPSDGALGRALADGRPEDLSGLVALCHTAPMRRLIHPLLLSVPILILAACSTNDSDGAVGVAGVIAEVEVDSSDTEVVAEDAAAAGHELDTGTRAAVDEPLAGAAADLAGDPVAERDFSALPRSSRRTSPSTISTVQDSSSWTPKTASSSSNTGEHSAPTDSRS